MRRKLRIRRKRRTGLNRLQSRRVRPAGSTGTIRRGQFPIRRGQFPISGALGSRLRRWSRGTRPQASTAGLFQPRHELRLSLSPISLSRRDQSPKSVLARVDQRKASRQAPWRTMSRCTFRLNSTAKTMVVGSPGDRGEIGDSPELPHPRNSGRQRWCRLEFGGCPRSPFVVSVYCRVDARPRRDGRQG